MQQNAPLASPENEGMLETTAERVKIGNGIINRFLPQLR
jgi:hypothetical protein